MFENILAIIPCRAGSQRFPGKNMADFNDKPLAVHKVQQAMDAGLTNIVVTTNDPEVVKAVSDMPVEVINRIPFLCQPDTTQEHVIEDAIFWAQTMHMDFDTFCSLQVTSPTLAVESLVDALNKYQNNTCKSIAAVTEAYQPSGGFHIVDTDLFLGNLSLYQEDGFVYVLPPEECLDIDYKYQLSISEAMYKCRVFGCSGGSCSCSK